MLDIQLKDAALSWFTQCLFCFHATVHWSVQI